MLVPMWTQISAMKDSLFTEMRYDVGNVRKIVVKHEGGNISYLIWGVCILLRVWYRMMWVLIRLRNVTIVG
jgi:hypothetical protein